MTALRWVAVTGLFALTAGCGGSATSPFESYFSEAVAAQTMAGRIEVLPNSAFVAMPVAGSARFTGYGGLVIDPVAATDSDDIAILGDAELIANFGTGRMTGTVRNMVGATNLTETGGDIVSVSGTIVIGGRESVIGNGVDDNRTDRRNQFYADYAGTLTIEGNRYAVEGALNGDFRGTRVNPPAGLRTVRAIYAADEDGFAAINGAIEEVPAVFEIVAEN